MKTKELIEAADKVIEILDKHIEAPQKMIDLVKPDEDPKKVLAKLKQLAYRMKTLADAQDIQEIAHPDKKPLISEKPMLVKVRVAGEEETHLGIYIGRAATTTSFSIEENTVKLDFAMHNPAIFVPKLERVVYGMESWWGKIKNEEELKEITDEDISNVWYVKAFKAFSG